MLKDSFNYMIGIVTYNPDINRLALCIEKITQNNHRLIIVDNGSKNVESIKKIIYEIKSVSLIENKINYGVAKALNQIFGKAQIHGCEWVLVLDQDTIIPDNLIERYKQVVYENRADLAIICPLIHDESTNITWPVLGGDESERYVEKCITSASFNSIKMWERVGGFDENLFIDEVDHDYCYRVRKEGGKILLVNGVIISHIIGNSKAYTILGRTIIVRNHSAFRKYYITRNMLIIDRKQHGKITIRTMAHCVLFLMKIMVFENDKKKKILASCKGIRDGVRGL